MLHITNGDAAAGGIRAAGVDGPVLPWRDVLHEGPVPGGFTLPQLGGVRALFLATCHWTGEREAAAEFSYRDRVLEAAGAEDEVVLWFEHDLYDQLQLIQLLDWFAGRPPVQLTLINPAEYLGNAAPARLAGLFAVREPVTAAQLELGQRAWEAFRTPTPLALQALLEGDTSALPHLAGAVRRLLEQLPGADDGLSRSERFILRALLEGERSAGELFALHNAAEDPVWLGDSTFALYLRGLAVEPHPLIQVPRGEGDGWAEPGWHRRRVSITGQGRAVVAGTVDAVALRGVDRWQGGVHLRGREGVWRWDREAGRIVSR